MSTSTTTTAPPPVHADGRVATVPRASLAETLAVVAEVITPVLARGVVLRRPGVVAMTERFDLDRRAVRRVQRLRDRYGSGPLLLRTRPGLPRALVLAPEHVRRVLDESPEPFAVAAAEKRAILAHFQPQGVLLSHGPERTDRRRFNEQVLEAHRPMHRLAQRFGEVVQQEATGLLGDVRQRGGVLDWEGFADAWFRIVRRVVFGDSARDDRALRALINRLRADANWVFLRPKRERLIAELLRRIREHLARAEPGSLAAVIASTPTTPATAPEQQVPQWLFAFDATAIAMFRALALLASHPDQASQARQELQAPTGSALPELPYLRACLLESVRLWPTTPVILRQTTRSTEWETGTLPAGTGVVIFVPFFHRDDERLAYADRFTPELSLGPRADRDLPLIPFSDGPGFCPGEQLALLLGSTMLAALLAGGQVRLRSRAPLDPARPLPGTLNPYALSFGLSAP